MRLGLGLGLGKYRLGWHNAAADALSRQPLAGEPANPEDVEYDDCVTICNVVNKGTPLDPELLTAGDQCCKIRQIRAVEGGPRGDGANAQGGTFSLPGHTKGQLRDFQLKYLILHSFRKCWDHK